MTRRAVKPSAISYNPWVIAGRKPGRHMTDINGPWLAVRAEAGLGDVRISDSFRRTVWANPDLDYTTERPVGALAKQLWSEERRTQRHAALSGLSERYGLIYLGHAGCAACRVFGPLLRAFALRHGLDVLAVSMTGEALDGWPGAVPDNGRAARLGLSGAPLPAVVLFDSETGTVVPVAFGVMAKDQLAERIFVLTTLETGVAVVVSSENSLSAASSRQRLSVT